MYALTLSLISFRKYFLRNSLILLILIFGFMVPYADANQFFAVQTSVESGRLRNGFSEIRMTGEDEVIEIANGFRNREGIAVSTVQSVDAFKNGRYARLPVMVFDSSYLESHDVIVTEGELSASPDDKSCYVSTLHNNSAFSISVGDEIQLGQISCIVRGRISSYDFWMPIWVHNTSSLDLYAPGYQKTVLIFVKDELLPDVMEDLVEKSVDTRELQIRTSEELFQMNQVSMRGGTFTMLRLSAWIVLAACLSIAVLSFARFDAEKKKIGVRMCLGASPCSIFLENAIGFFLLGLISAPILRLLLPVYLKWSRFMPEAPVDFRVFLLYLMVQAGISILYGMIVTLVSFRKPVIESVR